MFKLKGRLTLFFLVFLSIIVLGIFGFHFVKLQSGEPSTMIDAISWTIVTLTTLGAYTPDTTLVTPLGKLFTSMVVILGIALFFIGTPLVLVPWFETKVSSALRPKPFPIPEKNHVIICGYNPIIDEVIDSLRIHGFDYIVVSKNQSDISICQKEKIPYIFGDPSNDEILKKANIDTCISLIAVADVAINAFICLTAKSLRNDLNVITIADKTEHVKALYAAGASRVINPKIFAGSILGRRAGHEYSLEISGKFAVFGDLEIRQYAIPATSALCNLSINEVDIRSMTGSIIIGLWKDGDLIVNPSPDEILTEGTTVLVMGKKRQLNMFYRLVGGLR